MSASPSTVLTQGLGPWSDAARLVTLGFGGAVIVAPPDRPGPTSLSGREYATSVSGRGAALLVSGRHGATALSGQRGASVVTGTHAATHVEVP